VVARLFDPAGRQVRALDPTTKGADTHGFVWDGRDAAGRPLPAGAYLCRFESNGRTIGSIRVVKIR
jgi:flagellar hook assembly protein FlgD